MDPLLLDLGEVALAAADHGGTGPLVCLLPGLGGGLVHLEHLGTELARRGFRAVALEPRGGGGGRGAIEGITLHDLADDVARAVRQLGPPAALVGCAFGGRLARCVAADHTDLVRGVVLVAAGGRVPPEPIALEHLQVFLDDRRPAAERLAAAEAALFAPGNRIPPGFLEDGRSSSVADAQMAALARTDPAAWWAGGEAPLLVIQGTEDRIAPPGNGHLLRAELGERVTVVDLEGAGHAVLLERQDAVVGAATDFLSRLP